MRATVQSVSRRIDGLEVRLDRIETKLDEQKTALETAITTAVREVREDIKTYFDLKTELMLSEFRVLPDELRSHDARLKALESTRGRRGYWLSTAPTAALSQ